MFMQFMDQHCVLFGISVPIKCNPVTKKKLKMLE